MRGLAMSCIAIFLAGLLLIASRVGTLVDAQAIGKKPVVKAVFVQNAKDAPKGWQSVSKIAKSFKVKKSSYFEVPGATPEFRYVLSAKSLVLRFKAKNSGSQTLRLGLIEPNTNCKPRKRRTRFEVNGVMSREVDVAREVGCRKPLYVDVPFSTNKGRIVQLKVKQTDKFSIIISNLRLYDGNAAATPFPNPSDVNIVINAKKGVQIDGTKPLSTKGSILTRGVKGVPTQVFSTALEGSAFELDFDVPPGTYDVILGFAEIDDSKCASAARVFNVLINGQVRLSTFDVFSTTKGCRRAVVEQFLRQSIDPVQAGPLVIRFESVTGPAIINYIRVRASDQQCQAVTTDATQTADHLAHSVPGTYDTAIDTLGRGSAGVDLDGSASHTHFFGNGVIGRIKSYTWTLVDTGKVISTKAKFKYAFPLGSTRVSLTVIDTVCSQDTAETTITVTGRTDNGQYCYFYEGLTEFPAADTLYSGPSPSFADVSSSLKYKFPSLPFSNPRFVMRCLFYVNLNAALGFGDKPRVARLKVRTARTGDVRIWKGEDLLVDSTASGRSTPFTATSGLLAFELLYLRTDTSKSPKLSFKINNKLPTEISYDRSAVLPILSSLDPENGPLIGSTRVRINGYGLYPPLRVIFGGKRASIASQSPSILFVNTPRVTSMSTVNVVVWSAANRRSNSLRFMYNIGGDSTDGGGGDNSGSVGDNSGSGGDNSGSGGDNSGSGGGGSGGGGSGGDGGSGVCDPVQFSRKLLLAKSGGNFNLLLATCITIWQDGNLYVGTRSGVVHVVSYDPSTLTVNSVCRSHQLTDSRYKKSGSVPAQRSILGIAFDPRDLEPRCYVTVGTLFWKKQAQIDPSNTRAWSNGAVERLKPASASTRASNPEQCLEYDTRIVSNLPVGGTDHGINELVFTNDGDLLIAVGSLTNGGLPYFAFGGLWESYFSASVVVARLSRGPKYNPEIVYSTPDKLHTAVPKGDDVDLFATGFRNLFSLTMGRDGSFYGLDMGLDCKFGNISTSCSEYKESEADKYANGGPIPFPGSGIVGPPGECQYSGERNDKLVRIEENKFYGHSNIPRALARKTPGECAWVDPNTGRTPPPANKAPPSNYVHHLGTFSSPMTGLQEYGSNLFCGKMRGDLIFSRYRGQKAFRVEKDEAGNIDKTLIELTASGGMRVVENEFGGLILPCYDCKGVVCLQPIISSKKGVFVINAIPWRHGRAGGTLVRIGGWGFSSASKVSVGGNNCETTEVTSTLIVCKVPKHSGGSNSVSVTVNEGSLQSTLPKGIMYMSV